MNDRYSDLEDREICSRLKFKKERHISHPFLLFHVCVCVCVQCELPFAWLIYVFIIYFCSVIILSIRRFLSIYPEYAPTAPEFKFTLLAVATYALQ